MKNFKFSAIKTAFLAILPFLIHIKFTLAGGLPGITWPPISTVFPDAGHLAATMLGWYELLVRLVPSAQNNSIVSLLGTLLNFLVPNAAIASDGTAGTHEHDNVIAPTFIPPAAGSDLSVA